MSDTHFSEDAETEPTASPGEQLRREREAQGLSREEVASSLNLRPAVIQGLEEDQYDEVPVATYRRGYLRSYAHLLGIDDRPVLEAYRARHGSLESERKVRPVHITKPPSRLGTWLFRLVTLLVIAGLIGLTLLWWQSRGGNEPPDVGSSEPVTVDGFGGRAEAPQPDATEAPRAAPSEGDSNATSDALPPLPEQDSEMGLVEAPAASDSALTGAESRDPGAPAPESVEQPSTDNATAERTTTDTATAEPADAAAATSTAGEDATRERLLELTFHEQSWTEIFDADNQRVFVGLQEPGTTARVEGEPPFRLTVGNATGVDLQWRGESIDLAERAGANNVARFTLGD